METYKIALIPGIGVVPEVINEGVKVLKEAKKMVSGIELEFTHLDAGAELYKKSGVAYPKDVLEFCKKADAIYLGAMGITGVTFSKRTDVGAQVLIGLRNDLDLFINIRLIKLYPGIRSIISGKKPEDIGYVIFRELTEGLYASYSGGCSIRYDVPVDNLVITRKGT